MDFLKQVSLQNLLGISYCYEVLPHIKQTFIA